MRKFLIFVLSAFLLMESISFAWAEEGNSDNDQGLSGTEEYTITVESGGHGTVSGGGSGPTGTIVSAAATADAGYHFKEWQWLGANGEIQSSEANPQTFTISRNVTVTAVFETEELPLGADASQNNDQGLSGTEEYTITVESGGHGTVSGGGSGSAGTIVSAAATADAGYHFKEWQWLGANGEIQSSEANPQTFTISRNVTVTAVFETEELSLGADASRNNDQGLSGTEEYTITVKSGGHGTVSGGGRGPAGTIVSAAATADAGYHFKEWQWLSANGEIRSDAANPQSFMISRNVMLTAVFEADAKPAAPYTLTFKPGRSDVAGQEFSWPLYYGQTVILPGSSVFSKNGYQLIGWSFNQNASYVDYSAGGTATFFGNTVLYPVWSPMTPNKSIYVDYSDHGTVYWGNTKIGRGNSVPVQPGQTITLTFSPQNKYYVYGVNITGKHYSSLDSYTFSYDKMNGNQTVYVRFGSIYGAPKTGDDSNAAFWTVLGICSLCCGAAAGVLAKKKRWE